MLFAENTSEQNKSSQSAVSEQDITRKLWVDAQVSKFDKILRANYDKPVVDFCDAVIGELAKLTGSLRGLFYLYDSDKREIIPAAGYACNVQVLPKKKLLLGEGLIGQAVKSKESLVMNHIPEQKLFIESSMGLYSASSVLVVPLIFNNEVYGCLELLYLTEVTQQNQDLVATLANNITPVLQSIQNNERTKKLLEASLKQAEELRSIEEELRQNLEELSATQEEMRRKESEIQGLLSAINSSMLMAEFDAEGYITYTNANFHTFLGYLSGELTGKAHDVLVRGEVADSEFYRKLWADLKTGLVRAGLFKVVSKFGKELQIRAAFAPIRNNEGSVSKIYTFGMEIN